MIGKLLENWLDSASERSYQAVFVQMLSAQGYRVVHSTRHTALEYGKDVLAIAPDGTGCAYQLKGNPSGKLGLEQFRNEVQPQLVQLISQAIVFPGFPTATHKSYLVTNAYFDEEVQRAVDDLNRMPYLSKITLITRGELLIFCKKLGTSLWPSELDDSQAMLELFLSDPKDMLPAQKLSHLISKVLQLENTEAKGFRKSQYYRAVTSAALLTGIATARFAEVENHFAVASAWGFLSVAIIGATEKHGIKLDKMALQTLQLAEKTAADALAQLWKEVNGRKYLVEGNPLSDPEVYGWRIVTLLGLLSCLALADESFECLTEESRASLRQWLLRTRKNLQLWGESAVPIIIPWLVWLRKHDATLRPDFEIAGLCEVVIKRNQPKSTLPLASPYYSAEEIFRFNMHLDKSGDASSLGRESFAGSSYTAEALLHLLVRTNLKQRCKALWPDFTRMTHRVCTPDRNWEYCTLHISSGRDISKIYRSHYMWNELRADAIASMNEYLPSELVRRPWLLALWWQVVPYRFTTAASNAFTEGVLPCWGK